MEDQQALEGRQAAALPPLYVLDEMPENCYIPPEMFEALYGAPGGPQRTVVFAHKFIDPVTGLPIDRMVDQEKIKIDDHERFARVDSESPPPPTHHRKTNPQLVGGSRLPSSYQSNPRSPSPSPLPSSSGATKLPDLPLDQRPTSPPPLGDGSTCPAGILNAKPPTPPAKVERNASQASSSSPAASNPPIPAPSQAAATVRKRTRSAPHREARDLMLAQATVVSEPQILPRTRSASRQQASSSSKPTLPSGVSNRPLTRSASYQHARGAAPKPTAPSVASTRLRTRAVSHQQPRGTYKPATPAVAYKRPRTRSAPQPPSYSAPQSAVRSGAPSRTRTCSASRPEHLSHPTAGPAGPKRGRPRRVASGKEAVAQPPAVIARGPRRARPTRSVSRPKAGGASGRKRARPHDDDDGAAELAASAPRPKIRRLQKPRIVSGPQPRPSTSSLASKALPRPRLTPPIRSTRASKPRSCSLKSV
ncbi:hypothetical protein VP01_1369g1 [Puccinia sorghi]|uniref:Uncharacterized protein n=1 Tax=Puccinia sorghi TaxID=27349 RepID=A0A0L6VLW8_9BASI|nr:hypothetical protein VP01_1369g1 [Puccinia sorghi]